MGRFIYNLLMPVAFLVYLPKLIFRYRTRCGWKDTFGERFGLYGKRERELKHFRGAAWIHAVSVGETLVALSMIRKYHALHPERKFVLSTTTTTGQELARNNVPENTAVIFCPIDFPWMVKRCLDLLQPSQLVIFETEIWPNMISLAKKRDIPVILVNGRLSDRSARGYRRMKMFFAPLLRQFDLILAQSESDAERFLSVAPDANVRNGGNLKFDQKLPELVPDNLLSAYLGEGQVILAGSTHPGEEELIVKCYAELKPEFPQLKLALVPRHAERGDDIAEMLKKCGQSYARRSSGAFPEEKVDVLLADTTGEMTQFMKDADVVIMGKSFAGHDEGHNLIEPALLSKAIITGTLLRNFRFLLGILQQANAVVTANDSELSDVLRKLLKDEKLRAELGDRAFRTIGSNGGAVDRAIEALEEARKDS